MFFWAIKRLCCLHPPPPRILLLPPQCLSSSTAAASASSVLLCCGPAGSLPRGEPAGLPFPWPPLSSSFLRGGASRGGGGFLRRSSHYCYDSHFCRRLPSRS